MALVNCATGEAFALPTPAERERQRLARMRHMVWLGCKTAERMAKEDGTRIIMYTLTYAGIDDWKPLHVTKFARWLRQKGHIGYLWVGELQKRGAVHYHVMALLPRDRMWTKPSSQSGGWAHGFTWVTDDVRFPLYLMKYLQKGQTNGSATDYPPGFRLFAISQSIVRRMCFEHSAAYRKSHLPRWVWSGKESYVDVRCAFRVRGGVGVGRFTALTPYRLHSDNPLATIGG